MIYRLQRTLIWGLSTILFVSVIGCSAKDSLERRNKNSKYSDLEIKQKIEKLSEKDIVLKYSPEQVLPYFSEEAISVYALKDRRMIPHLREALNDEKTFVVAHVLLVLLTQKNYKMSPVSWGGIRLSALKENPKEVQRFVREFWSNKKNLTIVSHKRLRIGFLPEK